ncbi:hypothetical protein ADUPG1_005179, partial [Aduncisulcus paluster]
YIRRYQEALRLMSEDETISGDNLYSHFMRGIKHRQFRIRMEAALQDEPKDIDTFTRVTFEQLALVLETMEDAKGYLNPYQSRSSASTSKGTSGSYESRTTEARKKFHERTRRNSTGSFNSEIVCFNRGQKGHIASKCPNTKKTSDKRRYSMKAVSTSKPEAPYFTCNVWVKG